MEGGGFAFSDGQSCRGCHVEICSSWVWGQVDHFFNVWGGEFYNLKVFNLFYVWGWVYTWCCVWRSEDNLSSQEHVCLGSNTGHQAQQQAPLPTGLFDEPLK